MDDEEQLQPGEVDLRLLTLIMSLATAAWSQLGKIPHPTTNKIEKDLEQAKMSIDFLRMLLEKTKGNLRPKEDELLTNTVSDLEMNFADEVNKGENTQKDPEIIVPSGSAKDADIITP